MMLKLFPIRHGETDWSLSGQHSGRADLALTKNGEDEASNRGRVAVANKEIAIQRWENEGGEIVNEPNVLLKRSWHRWMAINPHHFARRKQHDERI